jgi:hypothetical protein
MRARPWLVRGHLVVWLICAITAPMLMPGCSSDDNPAHVDIHHPGAVELPTDIPPPTSPTNLVQAIVGIYNSGGLPAAERLRLYASLFPPADHPRLGFVFRFQPRDVESGAPPNWGLEDELRSTGNMFKAQENGQIAEIALTLHIASAEPIELQAGKEGWIRVLATDVNLSVLTGPESGMHVSNGMAEFQCAPDGDRWYITDWRDVPVNP